MEYSRIWVIPLVGLLNLHNILSIEFANCRARPIPIQTNDRWKSYIELHRCTGRDSSSPQNYHCVYITSENVPVNDVLYVNHTSCAMKCACNGGENKDEHCTSPRRDVFCYPGHQWDSDVCQCVLSSSCPQTRKSTQQGEHISCISLNLLLFVSIAQLIVVVVLMHCWKRLVKRFSRHYVERDNADDNEWPVFNRQYSLVTPVTRRTGSRSRNKTISDDSIDLLDHDHEHGR